MCVAIPGLVKRIIDEFEFSRMAEVEFADGIRSVDLVMTPDAGAGDQVIVHSGYAIRVVAHIES
ncbi:MAG: HypC/HybG/HupF family hydrogenase formation chaperone [Acidimicrobiia bacterium]|nr:HypC/HybG/HupF family hydrogenase formation chaperone [Acidimicrobiia bacterium]MDH4309169.1 HypC/HybG/HupF family hydrogenase formation chaperone [Acidimicrobiia bacterium]